MSFIVNVNTYNKKTPKTTNNGILGVSTIKQPASK